jgi:cold shock CspA family protein
VNSPGGRGGYSSSDQATVEEFGTAKFFAADKGFGFILEISAAGCLRTRLARTAPALRLLSEGQRVAMDVTGATLLGRRSATSWNILNNV